MSLTSGSLQLLTGQTLSTFGLAVMKIGRSTIPEKLQLFPPGFPNTLNNAAIVLTALIGGRIREVVTRKSGESEWGSKKKWEGKNEKERFSWKSVWASGNLWEREGRVGGWAEETSGTAKQQKVLFCHSSIVPFFILPCLPLNFPILNVFPNLFLSSLHWWFCLLPTCHPFNFPHPLALCSLLSLHQECFTCHTTFVSHFLSIARQKEDGKMIQQNNGRRREEKGGKTKRKDHAAYWPNKLGQKMLTTEWNLLLLVVPVN